MSANGIKDKALIDALELVEKLAPHTQSGWYTEKFNRALDIAKTRAEKLIDDFVVSGESEDSVG